jgi:hypothetical protein
VMVFKVAEETISPWQWLQNKEIHVLQNVLTNRCSWSSQNKNIRDEVFFFAKALCKARMPGWFGPTKKKCFFWFFFWFRAYFRTWLRISRASADGLKGDF